MLEKEAEKDLGNKVMRMRKFSHLASRRQVAMGIYNAPVVSNRYKKVVNHFQNKSKSNAVEIRGLGD